MNTFYWHDYETWGINPRFDRACQFAGIRTDLDFNIIDKPLEIYARPASDILPAPEACMVTHLTPQKCLEFGIPEADFFKLIHQQLASPETIGLGYNTLRFDDEVTRYGFYRNFIDPYGREWQNNCGRWDIIDVTRLCHALRPEGINWPQNDDGTTSFRLEKLTEANNIAHQGAHDALVDVKATIAWAKLLKQKQTRLFDYVFNLRSKAQIARQLDLNLQQAVLHVSAKYPARLGCIASVVPLFQHPINKNEIIVYDLRVDPTEFLLLSAEEIKTRLYTRSQDLPEGVARLPLKGVHINKTPIIVPLSTLTPALREKWQMPEAPEQAHLQQLINAKKQLAEKLTLVYGENRFANSGPQDPDESLYGGGFISKKDKLLGEQIQQLKPTELANFNVDFQDKKFNELLFRYRARNWSKTLTVDEQERWQAYRQQRFITKVPDGAIGLSAYQKTLSKMILDVNINETDKQIINALLDWPQEIGLS